MTVMSRAALVFHVSVIIIVLLLWIAQKQNKGSVQTLNNEQNKINIIFIIIKNLLVGKEC